MSLDVEKKSKRSRLYSLLILCVIVLPMALAYVMFKSGWGIPQGTTNKGNLLQPPQLLSELVLNNQDEKLKDLYSGEAKRWRILVPIAKDCDSVCEQYLYLTRQVHIRLAEKAYRVERILLLLDNVSDEYIETLKQQHPSTLMATTNLQALEQWLSRAKLPASADRYFYLVDQEGYAMMRFDSEHSGQDLLDDLKKLLKYTYDK